MSTAYQPSDKSSGVPLSASLVSAEVEKEFMNIVQLPATLAALEEVEVNPVQLIDFFDLFFAEEAIFNCLTVDP